MKKPRCNAGFSLLQGSWMGRKSRISLYFPWRSGNLKERAVRTRLRHPHSSLRGFGHVGESIEISECARDLRSCADPENPLGGATEPRPSATVLFPARSTSPDRRARFPVVA